MKQITIRGIPNEVEKIIREEAEKKGASLNKAFLTLLEKVSGVKGKEKKKKTLHHDLDHLSGIWTKKEWAAFRKNLGFQRKIDGEIWKKTG